jgi:hypothetical protein
MPPWGSVPMKGAVMADPPYDGTVHFNRNIITAADPTTFLNIGTHLDPGERSMFDRRLKAWAKFNAYLFDASFDDGLAVEIQVNPEFGPEEASMAAWKYCPVIGKLPTVLRTKLKTVSIHQGGGTVRRREQQPGNPHGASRQIRARRRSRRSAVARGVPHCVR